MRIFLKAFLQFSMCFQCFKNYWNLQILLQQFILTKKILKTAYLNYTGHLLYWPPTVQPHHFFKILNQHCIVNTIFFSKEYSVWNEPENSRTLNRKVNIKPPNPPKNLNQTFGSSSKIEPSSFQAYLLVLSHFPQFALFLPLIAHCSEVEMKVHFQLLLALCMT